MCAFEGLILKGVGGFYTVQPDDDAEPVVCRPRGRFRLDGIRPLPGDRVTCSRAPDGMGRIEAIHPRRNVFARPPVANMDALILVVSQAVPKSDPWLIDRMTVLAEREGLRVIICVNKIDLHPARELVDIYDKTGYPTLCVSARTGEGIPALLRVAAGQTAVFAGNSGVGKSSLLNCLCPGLALETAEVSLKGGRGRHTTRHVELIPMGAHAYVTDTPGFSAFEPERAESPRPEAFQALFPEINPFEGACRFTGCLHLGAEGCAVWAAAARGDIAASRFENYKRMVRECKGDY